MTIPTGMRWRISSAYKQQQLLREQREESAMEEQVWISHIRAIALDDDWITVTDLMDRKYRLDPQAALELAVWIAKHHQDVAQAQVNLQVERRMEEARLYGPLLGSSQVQSKEDPATPLSPTSPPPPSKQRRRSPRKKEET